jgi:hypothetical protein
MKETPAGQAAVRELPNVADLERSQREGRDCVYCGDPLTADDVTDLGVQEIEILGQIVAWFPRSHPRCLEGEDQ